MLHDTSGPLPHPNEHEAPQAFPRGPDMMTVVMLAIVGAFACGFVLGGMLAVGAAADGARPADRDDSHEALAVASLGVHARRGRMGRGAST